MPRKVLTAVVPAPREDGAIQVEVTLPVRQGRRDASVKHGLAPYTASRPRIPRITRLMALAIKFQDMVNRGEVRDYADLARLGYVTRARITQIMNLLMLAPDLRESLLHLTAPLEKPLAERHIRSVAAMEWWESQRAAMRRFGCHGEERGM